MSDLDDSYIPYAGASGVIMVLRRLRDAAIPDVLDIQSIQRIGISKGVAGRTIAAIKFLGIIDETGKKTDVHDRLAKASTEDYPDVLADVLKSAYSEIFKLVDPTNASDIGLHDAFRGFEPAKQRSRMVSLFVSLCQEAGIIEGTPTIVQRSISPSQKTSNNSNGSLAKPQKQNEKGRQEKAKEPPAQHSSTLIPENYEILAAYFRKLPPNKIWTQSEMELWLKGVEFALKMEIEIKDDVTDSQ